MNFNDIDEANSVLNRLHNSYRYRQVYRPYIGVTRQALGPNKQPSLSPEAQTMFPDAVLGVLKDPPDRSSFGKLVGSGPAGVPFLAEFVGHPERSIHISVCFKLRPMGTLAIEATPALRNAVNGEHSKFTLMALERINPSAHADVIQARQPVPESSHRFIGHFSSAVDQHDSCSSSRCRVCDQFDRRFRQKQHVMILRPNNAAAANDHPDATASGSGLSCIRMRICSQLPVN